MFLKGSREAAPEISFEKCPGTFPRQFFPVLFPGSLSEFYTGLCSKISSEASAGGISAEANTDVSMECIPRFHLVL